MNRLLQVGATGLALFLLPLLSVACGMLDIHVEMPGEARTPDVVTGEAVVASEHSVTAERGAEATITALAAESVHLAAQLTSPATPPTLTTSSVTPTRTPQPTTTSTDTPKATATPAKTLQPTPQPASTPDEPPQILSFTASPDPVERGGTVTLTWNAQGMTDVGITRLSPEGDIFLETEAFHLPASGSIALPVSEEYTESIKYVLGARDATGALHTAYVTASVICRYDRYIASRCPLSQDTVWAAYEPFEHGYMVWRSDTREIYVLYADGSYEIYEDTWHEGDPVDISGTPPPGLHAPVRGFGNLYAQQPRVRERLGWTTAPEAGYTMWVETIRGGSGRYPGTSTYFTLPDNHVVNLYPFTSTWEIVL